MTYYNRWDDVNVRPDLSQTKSGHQSGNYAVLSYHFFAFDLQESDIGLFLKPKSECGILFTLDVTLLLGELLTSLLVYFTNTALLSLL